MDPFQEMHWKEMKVKHTDEEPIYVDHYDEPKERLNNISNIKDYG